MEKIIRDVLIDYMEENGFFTKHQHGFRKGRSCATQLIEVMESNFGCIESDPCDFVSFIFCRCFFTVSTSNLRLSSFKSVLELKVGMVSFSGSFVKTLWKNAFRSSALHLFSVCISPYLRKLSRTLQHQ
jgi:hypothetical protein